MSEFIGGLALGLIVGLAAGLSWMVHVFKGYDKYWKTKLSDAESKAYSQGEKDAWNFAVQTGKNVRRFVEGSLK